MHSLLKIILLPALLFAQEYYEAFGQTVPFNLTAGAEAGWDQGIGIERPAKMLPAELVFSIRPNPAGRNFSVYAQGFQGQVRVEVYNIAGKKAGLVDIINPGTTVFPKQLANGIYFARFSMGGRMMRTVRFLVVE